MGMLGLAKRAGKISSGESACKEAIRFGKSKLIFLAEDASSNTAKSITDSCNYYNVSYLKNGTKERLGHAVGNAYNAEISVNDEGFAQAILKHIKSNSNESE